MGAGIVDKQQIALLNFRQLPVNGKLIVIFTQAAYYVVHLGRFRIFFTQHRDVVIRTVHGRAHQVGCAGVHPDIFLVDVFFVDSPGHQGTVRRQHETSHFRKKADVA